MGLYNKLAKEIAVPRRQGHSSGYGASANVGA